MKTMIFISSLILSMNLSAVELDVEVEMFDKWNVIKFTAADKHKGFRALQINKGNEQVLNFDLYEEDCNDMMVTINSTLPRHHELQGTIPQGSSPIVIDDNKPFTADIKLKADTGMTIAVYEIYNVSEPERFASEIRKGRFVTFELKAPLMKKVKFELKGLEEAIQRMTQLCVQDIVDKLENSKPVK